MSDSCLFSRRLLLKSLTLGMAGIALPLSLSATENQKFPPHKRLIVIELFGGNDSLNTLVPYTDPLYKRYRPNLALNNRDIVPLSTELALNAAWKDIAEVFQRGELAIVQDVGYPQPNLSHFGSAAIWASGSLEAGQHSGWAGQVISTHRIHMSAQDADGIILSGNQDLMQSRGAQVLTLQDSKSFLSAQSRPVISTTLGTQNPAAHHLEQLLDQSATLRERIRRKIKTPNRFNAWFTKDGYTEPQNMQAALLLWLIENDINTPLFKLSLSGFDLHSGLRGEHERLLGKVQTLLLSLRKGLMEMSAWKDSLILVHSEFGRRPQENASAGTDHGTSGLVLLCGGSVSGGLWGQQSSLQDLDSDGNLKFTTDFRAIYASIIQNFWGLSASSNAPDSIAALGIKL
ncbi:DUF1501 domain-containing protein [Pseudomonas lijiangensis]|uniref:DUF1501 domain-containing protein n=1 Tax=Pseudomonas lijiangensis TaxID=2995658 RepID=UPI0031BABBF5